MLSWPLWWICMYLDFIRRETVQNECTFSSAAALTHLKALAHFSCQWIMKANRVFFKKTTFLLSLQTHLWSCCSVVASSVVPYPHGHWVMNPCEERSTGTAIWYSLVQPILQPTDCHWSKMDSCIEIKIPSLITSSYKCIKDVKYQVSWSISSFPYTEDEELWAQHSDTRRSGSTEDKTQLWVWYFTTYYNQSVTYSISESIFFKKKRLSLPVASDWHLGQLPSNGISWYNQLKH